MGNLYYLHTFDRNKNVFTCKSNVCILIQLNINNEIALVIYFVYVSM